jgi:NitT/TauT family transport system substrate-binding protein
VGRANGRFEQSLGPGARVEWKTFNAGPSAIEALFAGAVDLIYVGPNPTITGYIRSQGEALRVVAGAASGGTALVVRTAANIHKPEDFHGKKVASPQLGNTQDVALRAWLLQNNLKATDKGGDVQVIPLANPDQLTLFQKGQLDASWAPEPWATRLIQEGGAQLFLDERSLWPNHRFVITEIVVRTDFLKQHPDLVKKWLAAHVDLTDWINKNTSAAKAILNQQIAKDTGRALPPKVLDEAFGRLELTYDPIRSSLLVSANRAYAAGFLKHEPELSNLYSLDLLNEVLREKKLTAVQ